MRPDSFEDISAVLALYRPGPMAANAHVDYADRKNGRKPITAIHPELAEPLAEILDETYGLVVYQEQVQAIARKVAGYSLGQADLLRKAMGKKKKAELNAQLSNFTAGMPARGFSDKAINALWNTLLPFCDYGFNKSHTAGYGLVSYWTAYLKANYPAEYMAALLTSVRDDKDKSAVYLNECRRMGIKVLPPDVNESEADFTPVGTDIRFGLDGDPQRRRQRRRRSSRRRAEAGQVHRLRRLHDEGARAPSATSGCSSRCARPVPSTPSATPGVPWSPSTTDAVDQYLDLKRNEAIGQDSLFGGLDDATSPAISVQVPTSTSGTSGPCSPSSATCSGCTCPTTRSTGSSTCSRRPATSRSASSSPTRSGRTAASSRLPGWSPPSRARRTKKGDLYAVVTIEDLEGAIDVHGVPARLPAVVDAARRGLGRRGQRKGQARPRRGPRADRAPRSRRPTCSGEQRPARWSSRCPR